MSPSDPVLKFICDPTTRNVVTLDQHSWPWSRISGSRLDKIGYKLIVLRCAQIGIDPPTRKEASGWVRTN